LATLLTLLAFVGERTSSTLDRLMVTPLQENEVVLGYALAFWIIGMIQAAFLLAVAVLVFNIMILGNVFLAFLVVALLAVVSQALGILLSSLAKREGQVIQFIPFIILPAFLAHRSDSKMVKAIFVCGSSDLCCGCLPRDYAQMMGSL